VALRRLPAIEVKPVSRETVALEVVDPVVIVKAEMIDVARVTGIAEVAEADEDVNEYPTISAAQIRNRIILTRA
jgi:hypothetical protein